MLGNDEDLVPGLVVLQPRVNGLYIRNVAEAGIQLFLDGSDGLLPGLVGFIASLVRYGPAVLVATVVVSVLEGAMRETDPARQCGGTQICTKHLTPV